MIVCRAKIDESPSRCSTFIVSLDDMRGIERRKIQAWLGGDLVQIEGEKRADHPRFSGARGDG